MLYSVEFTRNDIELTTKMLYSFGWSQRAAQTYVKIPFFGAVSYLTLAVTPFCIVFAVVWGVKRRVSYAWIGQDILVRLVLLLFHCLFLSNSYFFWFMFLDGLFWIKYTYINRLRIRNVFLILLFSGHCFDNYSSSDCPNTKSQGDDHSHFFLLFLVLVIWRIMTLMHTFFS